MLQALMSFLKKALRMIKRQNTASQPDARTAYTGPKGPDAATRVLQPAHTKRLRPEPEEAVLPEPSGTDAPLELAWHGITDIGVKRDHNEDSFSLLDLGQRALFVVADGMGGHDAGEVASRIAVEAVCEEVRKGQLGSDGPLALVERAMQRANAEVKREGKRRGSNMGTTLTTALIADGIAHIGSVGDSRAYWIENGSITQITEDHSLVAKLISAGKLAKEEARNHPRSNLLYRTIGNDDTVKVGAFRVELRKGGTLLLCTDGLWGEVTDEKIHRVCAGEKDTAIACARLVRMAKESGGRDNITAVVVRVV